MHVYISVGCSESCLQDVCVEPNECSLIAGQDACNSSKCILLCQNTSPSKLLTVTEGSQNCDEGQFNISLPTSMLELAEIFEAGFYIIDHLQFCSHVCIDTIQLHTVATSSINESNDNLLEFHVYKRYEDDLFYYYEEVFSFNVSLTLTDDTLEATPIYPENDPLCLQGGEYLGFTIRGNLKINSTSARLPPFHGVHVFDRPPIFQCSSASTTLKVGQTGSISVRVPVVLIQFGKCTTEKASHFYYSRSYGMNIHMYIPIYIINNNNEQLLTAL